jgi:hypothetical protein
MKTPKTSVQRPRAYAEGGSTRMAKPQAAGPQKPGGTAHNVKGSAPGAKSAKGGGHAGVPGRVLAAKGGRTGVR